MMYKIKVLKAIAYVDYLSVCYLQTSVLKESYHFAKRRVPKFQEAHNKVICTAQIEAMLTSGCISWLRCFKI